MADGGSVTDLGQMEAMVAKAQGGLGRRPYPDQQCRHPARQELRQDGDGRFPRGGRRPPDRLGQLHQGGLGDDARAGLRPHPDDQLARPASTAISARPITAPPSWASPASPKTLALEGARDNIRVNTIAPTAATRMTEDLFPPELLARFQPELVAPAALFLVSRGRADRRDPRRRRRRGAGGLRHADPGRRARRADARSGRRATGRAITDRDGEIVPQSGAEQAMTILQRLQGDLDPPAGGDPRESGLPGCHCLSTSIGGHCIATNTPMRASQGGESHVQRERSRSGGGRRAR